MATGNAAWIGVMWLAGLACVLWLMVLVCVRHGRKRSYYPLRYKPAIDTTARPRNQRKPDWVIAEVLRLKALAPDLSCRDIAEIFNRRFAIERQMTVGRTWINDTLRQRKAELLRLRRDIKHRVPTPIPRNRVWAMDLTGKGDLGGKQRIVLGLLDHGTRACLRLTVLTDKTSLTLLRTLIGAFRQFGLPKAIRTDNEPCFTS